MTRPLALILTVIGALLLGWFWGLLIERLIWRDNGARPGDPSYGPGHLGERDWREPLHFGLQWSGHGEHGRRESEYDGEAIGV